MRETQNQATHRDTLQFERLVFFSDAVFAIAITLLVLGLKLSPSSRGVITLGDIGPQLFGFALSFAVIGVYWLDHHELFGTLRKEDALLRVVNLVFLATVVFLPFPTSVIAEFPATESSVRLYALSVAAVGVSITVLGVVARRRSLLQPGETRGKTVRFVIGSLAAPVVFITSALVAGSRPETAMKMWWLVGPSVWLAIRVGRWIGQRMDARLNPSGGKSGRDELNA